MLEGTIDSKRPELVTCLYRRPTEPSRPAGFLTAAWRVGISAFGDQKRFRIPVRGGYKFGTGATRILAGKPKSSSKVRRLYAAGNTFVGSAAFLRNGYNAPGPLLRGIWR